MRLKSFPFDRPRPGETNFNARGLKLKFFRGCLSGEAASGQEKLLGGCRLLTPPAVVRSPHPSDGGNLLRACVLYIATLTESTRQRRAVCVKDTLAAVCCY